MTLSTVPAVSASSNYRRAPQASLKSITQSPHANQEDVYSGRPSRPQSRETLRSLDDAFALVANLRSGILAMGEEALSAQANQISTGLVDLLS